ncbi:MAG TPA: tetratricopeptide repeat protein [Steroidobacteraceae bacterium]|nr:tetratricopeptide repeat protein [Steroidobacteraceae bacterium]
MRKYLVAWLLAVQASAVGVASLVIPMAVQAETVSKEVGKPLKAAQDAIAKKHWDEAMAKLKEADSQPKKSPYEEYAINDLMAYVLYNTRDRAGAAKYYELNLNSPQVPASQVPARVKQLAQLYFDLKNYPKAIEYGNRWLKNSPNDSDAYLLVAQSYMQQQDCKNASKLLQAGMDAARKADQPVKQNWLDMKLFCQDKLADKQGMIDTRLQLVRNYPSHEHWDALLTTIYSQQENDDLTTLNYYRLMLDLDVLKKPNYYKEMAEMDISAGVPGEALVVMNKGFANKVLDTKDKERYTRLLNNARTQAQEVQKKLPQLEQEARASKTADADINLGITYTGFAQYDKAVEALQRALQKNPGKRADEAQIALGRAYLRLNQKDAARKAFKAVPDDSKLARVAELYGIYASQS